MKAVPKPPNAVGADEAGAPKPGVLNENAEGVGPAVGWPKLSPVPNPENPVVAAMKG